MLTDSMRFFKHQPANHLLTSREKNEAYCLAMEGEEYAVYFTCEGKVELKAPAGEYEVR